jgi:hypothetical protein
MGWPAGSMPAQPAQTISIRSVAVARGGPQIGRVVEEDGLATEVEPKAPESLVSALGYWGPTSDPRQPIALLGRQRRRGRRTSFSVQYRSLLIIVVVIAARASADFLAFGRRSVVLAHLALDCDGFQFLRRVVPLASDRCAFIEIKFLGVIGPDQVFSGGGACLP